MKNQRRGRHSAIQAKSSTVMAAGAVATTAGVAFGAFLPAAVGADQEVSASELLVLENKVEPAASFTVPSGNDAYSFGNLTVEAEEPVVVEPVVEATPAVAQVQTEAAAPAAQAAPTQQAAPAAAPAQTQAAAAPAPQAAPAPAQQQAAPAPAPAPQAAPAVPAGNSSVVSIARAYAGSRYVYGGSTPAGFDCSGFTSFVYAQVGISLPRSSGAQLSSGYRVSAAQARPGDLVWWPGHVGIYTGNGQHIAARNPSVGVQEGPVYGSPVYIRVG